MTIGKERLGETVKIGIVAAMENEAALLKSHMEDVRVTSAAGQLFFEGSLAGAQCVIAKCGFGKVNAACCTQALIDRFEVGQVINVGVAGSVDDRLKVGDLVVSLSTIQHDMDASLEGFESNDETCEEQAQLYYADESLLRVARMVEQEQEFSEISWEGCIATGDLFVHTQEERARVRERFGALCCEMEGAAIAQVAFLNDLPFIIVRSISDCADGADPELYQQNENLAAFRAARFVESMLAHCAEQ